MARSSSVSSKLTSTFDSDPLLGLSFLSSVPLLDRPSLLPSAPLHFKKCSDGFVEYTLEQRLTPSRLSVGILCDTWPAWGFAAQAAGLDVKWCCGTTKLAKDMIAIAQFPWARGSELTPVDIVLCTTFRRPFLRWVGPYCKALIAVGTSF